MNIPTAVPAVVARSSELEVLKSLVDGTSESPAAVLLTGEAGIGKTALWRFAVEHGRKRGAIVMTARPAEDEMLGALVGLGDLLDHSAIDAAVLRPDLNALTRGRGLLDALRDLAETKQVVIAIDDLQWLDLDSARVLRYVFRRLEHESIRLLATWRIEPGNQPPTAPLSFPHAFVRTCHVGPLSIEELRRLLALQWGTVSPLTLRSIHAASNGNPLYAIEVARTLSPSERRAGIPPTAPLPQSLAGVIQQRLAGVGGRLLPLVELLAVAGRTSVSQIEQYLPDRPVGEMIIEGQSQGLVATDELMRVYLAHPLLSSGVEHAMNPLRRRELHQYLAERTTDGAVRARHLALATDEPDAGVADELEGAARTAQTGGSPAMSVEFARHSRRVTPPDDTEAVRRRMLLEANGRAAAGDASGACELYDELVAISEPGPERAQALLWRFYVENDDLALGDALLTQAVADAEEDPELQGRAMDTLAWYRGVFAGDLNQGIDMGRRAVVTLAETGAQTRHRWAQGHLVHMETLAGRPNIPLMRSLADYFDTHGPPDLGGGPRAWLAKQLLFNGDLAACRRELETVLADYDRRGFAIGTPYRFYDCALLEVALGNLDQAVRWAETGLTVARDAESGDIEGWLLYPLAVAKAWQGDHDGARRTADQLRHHPGRPGGSALGEARARSAIGLAELSAKNPVAAVEALGPAIDVLDEIGLRHPGAVPVLPDAAMAHAAAGDVKTAARLADRLVDQAERLGLERIDALARQVQGAVALARGDTEQAHDHLMTACFMFEQLELRPDAARCALLDGRALLRAGKRGAATKALTEAAELFRAMGAAGWLRQAEAALERASPGRAAGVLTGTEARIAALVSEGRKNREIAATLYVSVATVEAHLTRLYRKLGIRSRTELAALVHDGSLDVSPDPGKPMEAPG